MLNSNKLYIIGFMGSGKTTAGRKLAALLGWSFSDMDTEIEEMEGLKISEIFSKSGEPYFREKEALLLKQYSDRVNTVISTGGGAPCTGDNMDFMLSTGLTLYLKLNPAQLRSRLADSGSERPLIKEMTHDELLQFISEKLYDREKWYSRADITADGYSLNVKQLHEIVSPYLKA